MRHSVSLALLVAMSACSSDDGANAPQAGQWGSSEASLVVADTGSDLQIASGSCYAVYGHLTGRIPGGQFSLPGTYSQVTGVPPGYVDYPALYSGTADASTISLTITVSALGQSIGPVNVASGVTKTLTRCAVP